jgi:hypothetical protein
MIYKLRVVVVASGLMKSSMHRVGKNTRARAHFISGQVCVTPTGKKLCMYPFGWVSDTRSRIVIPS